jgi:thiamine-monophosphate kinase
MIMNFNNEKKTPFSNYKLVEKFSQFMVSKNDKLFIDASALFAEHIDFDLAYFPLKHLGYKIIVATMMDIFAMNGTPKQVRINIALSNRFAEDAIDELMSGIILCCSKFNINIVGLDFKPSATGLYIATSMIGKVEKGKEIYQNGAKENELICVTGDLGSAYTGLILLERENKVFQADPSQQPDFIGVDYLLERYLKPEPPEWAVRGKRCEVKGEGCEVKGEGCEVKGERCEVSCDMGLPLPTSMINLKNGLAAGLIQLCNASKLGCTIFEEKLPIEILTFDKLKELSIVATTIALNGGEDYELLFTIKQEAYEKIKEIKEVSVIGYMTAESSGRHIITSDNKQFELKAPGY